jgi:hypothetical protein
VTYCDQFDGIPFCKGARIDLCLETYDKDTNTLDMDNIQVELFWYVEHKRSFSGCVTIFFGETNGFELQVLFLLASDLSLFGRTTRVPTVLCE